MSTVAVAAEPVLQVDAVRALATTRLEKTLVSLVVIGGLAIFTVGLRAVGPRLKTRYTSDDVEALQAVVFSLAAAITSWLLVVIWNAVDAVAENLSVLQIGARQGALALVGVLTLVIAYTLTRVSKGLMEDHGGDVISAHRREAIHHILQIVVYVVATMFILSLAGVNPANLIVGAGAIGLIVGLAARQTLGSVLAGIVLLFARPFEVGDWVVVNDRDGIITDVTLFNTELRTWDDEHVMIPNDEVASSDIINRSRSGRLRVSVEVGVDYDTDVDRAAAIAERAMVECSAKAMQETPKPLVVGKQFADSAIVLECRFWISNPNARKKWRAQSVVIQELQSAFDEAGIKIPYPQRELMAREEADGFRLAGDGIVPPTDGNRYQSEPVAEQTDGEVGSVDESRDGESE